MAHIDFQTLAHLDHEQPSGELHWESASDTHVGRVRHINEDAYFDASELNIWAVADGMGGMGRGDYASKAVIKALMHFAWQGGICASLANLEEKLIDAHYTCQTAFRNKKPGSTVAALMTKDHYCFFLWAGDSRIYRLRDGLLEQLTRDHSLAQQKVDQGLLSPEEAVNHPSAHKLTRAIGANRELKLDLGFSPTQAGDRFLVCSDGLYNHVSDEEIQSYLGQNTPAATLGAMIDRALDCGGRDNITAIVVEASEPTN
ncbi:PP2C family serine/threonine-protein phosphatase [Agaribacterium sp. ZY112]|uniref:PP2C family protein-serine/threonine phosphatase n=1 Tax=Agaribacterium sp. ZY112 TaxID=3233574 RepID=UPI00352593C0